MIGAGEARGVAGVGAAQPVAAMAADIEKGAHPAGTVAHHQHRVLAHIGRQEIARLRDLAFVAQEQPAAGEDLLQLLLVDLRLDKDAPADEPPFAINKTTKLCFHLALLRTPSVIRESGNPGPKASLIAWTPAFAGA